MKMKKMIFGFAFAMLASAASAATDIVWNAEGDGPKMAPNIWYDYTDPGDRSLSSVVKDTDGKVKSAILTVTKGSKSNSAGFGFNWQENEAVTSLAAYKGACMTYKATAPFRVDFKQSTISDYNYLGAEIPAALNSKKTFIAFADLQKGWKSSSADWNVKVQTGVQFAFKESHANAAKVEENTVELFEFILSDSCETHAPTLSEEYAKHPSPDSAVVYEGDTLKLTLGDIFTDEDGDELNVTAKILPSDAPIAIIGKTFTSNDVMKLLPKVNTDGEAIIVLTASDEKSSVEYQLYVKIVDRDNPPTAVNDSYNTTEGKKLEVSGKNGVLLNDFSIDGATFDMALKDSTAHGILDLDATTGGFTYTPNAKYCGTDSWTYTLTDSRKLESAPAKVTIQIACVNDPPTVTVSDSSVIQNIELDEDFGSKDITIKSTQILFEDEDGDALTYGAYGDSLIKASVTVIGGSTFYITLQSVKDANGNAVVTFFAKDKTDSAKVLIPVKINPVADAPVAVNDTIEGFSDTTLVVSAKNGVLKNDYNPDGKTTLSAILKTDAEFGSVKLKEDGSFIYTPKAGWVADAFTYYITNAEGDTSEVATVYLNQNAPKTLVAQIDTTATEDFTKSFIFTKATVKTWFDSKNPLTYSVKSDDGKLNPSFYENGNLVIRAVQDSCGDAYVTVSATDKKSGIAEMKIHFELEPVNDRPRTKRDTIFVKDTINFVAEIDLDSIFFDPEGDLLSYEIVSLGSVLLQGEISGHILTIVPESDTIAFHPGNYLIQLKAWETNGDTTAVKGYATLNIGGYDGIVPQKAMPKLTWQQAISANRGVAKLFDVNGNLLWQGRLPASESAVRNAATRSAGRTILRVNNSQWLLSSEALR